MKQLVLLSGILLIGFVLFACASKVAPTENPSNSTTLGLDLQRVKKEVWATEWDRLIQEAKKEGKVDVYGPPNADLRFEFTASFQRSFPGITLEYVGITGAELAPKLLSERRAGLYLADIHIGGTTSMLSSLREILVPVAPFLVIDEVKSPASWRDNKFEYADDEGKLVLVFSAKIGGTISYNTQLISREKIDNFSLKELTMPEWKGKFLFFDPRVAGRGLEFAGWAYPNTSLGEDFFKGLAANDVIIGRDIRQMQEWVARGKYPLILAGSPEQGQEIAKAGLPIEFMKKFKEGNYLTSAFANVVILDKSPHPNAGKVFINWLLAKEAQTIWARIMQYPSLRNDVPTDFLMPAVIPDKGINYERGWTEDSVRQKVEIQKAMIQIFGTP